MSLRLSSALAGWLPGVVAVLAAVTGIAAAAGSQAPAGGSPATASATGSPGSNTSSASSPSSTAKPAKTAAGSRGPGSGAAAAGGARFPFQVTQKVLANGLKVVVIPYDSPGTVGYFTLVRTGSRDEVEPGHSGFAHFFEHMMFRGTDRYSQDRYNDILKGMGGDSNAFTTDDFTLYHTVGPVSELATIADMEADRFKNLKYTEEAFRTESLAILGEYNKNATSPFLMLEERMRDIAFTRHTYKHTTIGFLADVKAMPGYYQYSIQFHDRFYRPENCTVIVVGDVKPQQVFALAQQHYADWKTGYRPADIPIEPPQTEPKTGHVDWPSPLQPLFYAGYHIPAFSDRKVDSAALEVMAQLLFAESSPLYQELVVDKQWVDLLQGSADNHRDPYLFTIVARVKSADLVPQVEAAIDRAIAGLQAKPVPAQKLARIVSHLRNAFTLGLSTPGEVATQVAAILALTGDTGSLDRSLAEYPRVTPADVQRLARAVFKTTNRTVVTLTGPNAQPAGAGKPQGGARHADHQ